MYIYLSWRKCSNSIKENRWLYHLNVPQYICPFQDNNKETLINFEPNSFPNLFTLKSLYKNGHMELRLVGMLTGGQIHCIFIVPVEQKTFMGINSQWSIRPVYWNFPFSEWTVILKNTNFCLNLVAISVKYISLCFITPDRPHNKLRKAIEK